MRCIDFVRVSRSRLHCIEADDQLRELDGRSRLAVHLGFFHRLRDLGRDQARRRLREHETNVGRNSTLRLWEHGPT